MPRLIQCLLALALLFGADPGHAQAERFPARPIQVILTSTPGSQSDTLITTNPLVLVVRSELPVKLVAGIKATEITYKGASPAMLDRVAGRLDFIMADPVVADPFIKQGTIRALAVTAPVRLPSMKSLPTVAEAGAAGYADIATFLGMYAPRGTPRAVIDALDDAFVKVAGLQAQ
jgi:tripartite-type tricarboxylate transporter receptor subunit TctC